jgi:hypothetical protein
MTQKYLNINPIARMMSIETFRIFENESVDELIQKLATSSFDIFKKVVVDFAPAKQRKISTVKEKLKDTANSSTFKTLLAKMKDYAADTEIENSYLADVKSLYIDSMEQLADAIKRAIEIDPKLEDKVIKNFQSRTTKYANSLESAYKRKKEEEEELIEIEIDDVTYCTENEDNGFIYELDKDGNVGEAVGYFKNGEPFFN